MLVCSEDVLNVPLYLLYTHRGARGDGGVVTTHNAKNTKIELSDIFPRCLSTTAAASQASCYGRGGGRGLAIRNAVVPYKYPSLEWGDEFYPELPTFTIVPVRCLHNLLPGTRLV